MRILVAILTVGCVVSSLGASTRAQQTDVTRAAPANGWPQFRGTPDLSGVSAAHIPDVPELLWTLDVGESIDSSAAIVDGTVYVGTYAGELIAVDLETGTPKWRYEANAVYGIGESSPAVADQLVLIGDLEGVLHAVDVDAG